MDREILIDAMRGQTRVALVEDGRLAEIYLEDAAGASCVGNIYAARVDNVLPGMGAAFVDIGMDKNAFLREDDFVDNVACARPAPKKLKPGREIVVQVAKDVSGGKGARVTGHIALPGRMLVLLPGMDYVGISKRIEDEDERERLRAIAASACPDGMGLIVRTAGEGADADALLSDAHALLRLWADIQARMTHARAPALLHEGASLIHRAARDMLHADVRAVTVDTEALCARTQAAVQWAAPDLCHRVALYQGEGALFYARGIESQIEKALARRVWLKSGGYLVFDYAEALTAIDVNTGKYVGKRSLPETVLNLNLEAAAEIARQIRLRNLGGIIVIDFIDMDTAEERRTLMDALKHHLKADRTRPHLVGLTDLGLVELTRKKTLAPLHAMLCVPCPACHGGGWAESHAAIARRMLRQADALAQTGSAPAWLITASPPVAGQALLIGGADGRKIFIVPDAARDDGDYAIETALEHALPPHAKRLQ